MSVVVPNLQGRYGTLDSIMENRTGEAYAQSTWCFLVKIHEIGGGGANMTLAITRTEPALTFSFHMRVQSDGGDGVRPGFVRCNDVGGDVAHFNLGDTPETLTFGEWYWIVFKIDADDPDTVRIGVRLASGQTWNWYDLDRDPASPSGIPDDAAPPVFFAGAGGSATVWSTPSTWFSTTAWRAIVADATIEALEHPLQLVTNLAHHWPMDAIVDTDTLLDATGGNNITLTQAASFSISADAPVGMPVMGTASASFTKVVRTTSNLPDGNWGAAAVVTVGRSGAGVISRLFLGGLSFANDFGIPAGSTITSAIITAANCSSASPVASPISCDGLSEDFTEGLIDDGSSANPGEITRNNEPAILASSTTSGLALPTTTGAKTYNATTTFQALYAAGDLCAVRFKRDDESAVTGAATYSSDDTDADAWSLEIVWEIPPVALTVAEILPEAGGSTEDNAMLRLRFANNPPTWTPAWAGTSTDIEVSLTRGGSPVTLNGSGTPTVDESSEVLVNIVLDGPVYSTDTAITVTFPAGIVADGDIATAAGTDEAVTNGSDIDEPAAGGDVPPRLVDSGIITPHMRRRWRHYPKSKGRNQG